jgi:hypothetical protein
VSPGRYHTAAGSTLVLSGRIGGIAELVFDWLEEGGCVECVPDPYPDDGCLTWTCEHCEGGSTLWIED